MKTLLATAFAALTLATPAQASDEVEDRKRFSWAWVCCFVAAFLTYAAQIGAFSGDGPEM